MDLFADYTAKSGNQVSTRLAYTAGNLEQDQWTFATITPDTVHPGMWDPAETAKLTSRLSQPPKRGTLGYVTVITPNAISDSAYVDFTNAVSADCRYLHNNPSPPTGNTASQASLPLDTELPSATTMYNYDTNRDSDAGLKLRKTDLGLTESDSTKFQVWRSGALTSNLVIAADVLVDLWAAPKNFRQNKIGVVTTYLRDYCATCDPTHVEIDNASIFARDWQSGSSTFVERMGRIPGVNYTVPAGHELEIFMVVEKASKDDMWIAYDTTSYPSLLDLDYVTPTPTSSFYLHNDPTPPTGDTVSHATLSLDATVPTAGTLFNYDTNRDS